MFWLIERAWVYMAFNLNTKPRQEWDIRRARALRRGFAGNFDGSTEPVRFRYCHPVVVTDRPLTGVDGRAATGSL